MTTCFGNDTENKTGGFCGGKQKTKKILEKITRKYCHHLLLLPSQPLA